MIKIYHVTKKMPTIQQCLDETVYLAKNLEDAQKWVYNKILSDNYTHFTLWCNLHNEDLTDRETFERYLDGLYGNESPFDEYSIVWCKYKKNTLIDIFNQLAGFKEVGIENGTS